MAKYYNNIYFSDKNYALNVKGYIYNKYHIGLVNGYYKSYPDNLYYVTDFSINSWINKIPPSGATGYSKGANVYYDTTNLIKNWSQANTYCSSKGWRLPTLNETSSKITNGVPSYNNHWTSTAVTGGHYYWIGNSSGTWEDNNSFYLRCVY